MNTNRFGLLILLLGVSSASGHHSFRTTYDANREMEITGVVVDYMLRSPHSLLQLDVTGTDGMVERYEVELASLAMLRRLGFEADSFEPGDEVTVLAWPNRRPLPRVWGRAVTAADGRVLKGDAGSISLTAQTGTDSSSGIESLAGRWTATFRPQLEPLPITPAGAAALANFDPGQSPTVTCEPANIPKIFYGLYLLDIRITDEQAVLQHESYNVSRTVPLDSAPRQAESSGRFGMVSGRVEDDELVVESFGYPESAWGLALRDMEDVPSSAGKRVIERYSVNEDGSMLTIDYTLEDPVYLSEPYSAHANFARVSDDEPIYDYTCEVDSASLFIREQ